MACYTSDDYTASVRIGFVNVISKMTIRSITVSKWTDEQWSIPLVYCRKCPSDTKLFALMRQPFIPLPEQLTNYATFTKHQGHFLYQKQSVFL